MPQVIEIAMKEMEDALRRWKTAYDRLVESEHALFSRDQSEREEMIADMARLRRESDNALEELNRCAAVLRRGRFGSTA
jgi:hypothetical protein